ncbi:MAG: cyclic-di-AMP receptor, partial [Clostridia bacterium]|nr:cyclic-di-AMP receptor [Clostridia bacterium]
VTSALTNKGFEVTRLSTTGGFLNVGNTTLLIGIEDEKVPEVIAIFKQYCATRKRVKPSSESFGRGLRNNSVGEKVTVGGATFFVLNVEEQGNV